MTLIAKFLVGLIAFEHLYILYMEMFAWETLGKKTFKGIIPDDLFTSTKTLAANQGLYNGFLAAGLIFDHRQQLERQYFNIFLSVCHHRRDLWCFNSV
jgi:uncharacterized membrane protein